MGKSNWKILSSAIIEEKPVLTFSNRQWWILDNSERTILLVSCSGVSQSYTFIIWLFSFSVRFTVYNFPGLWATSKYVYRYITYLPTFEIIHRDKKINSCTSKYETKEKEKIQIEKFESIKFNILSELVFTCIHLFNKTNGLIHTYQW